MGRLGGQGGKGVLAFVGSSLKERDVKGGGIMRGLKRMYKIMNLNINNGSLSYNHQNNF